MRWLRMGVLVVGLAMAVVTDLHAWETLEAYDAPSVFDSDMTVVFKSTDTFVYHVAPAPAPMTIPGDQLGLGPRTYLTPDGGFAPIPMYVVNVRMALEAAVRYAADHGMDISEEYGPGNRMAVYVSPIDGVVRSDEGALQGGVSGQTWWKPFTDLYVVIDPGLSKEDMVNTPIHEFFHVVQNVLWTIHTFAEGLTDRDSAAHKMAKEGTAEFFTDQPIVLTPVGVNLGAATADGLNDYLSRDDYFTTPESSVFSGAGVRPYESVFFWKCWAERAGGAGPADQMAKVKAFWDGYSDQWSRARGTLIAEAGALVPGAGSPQERFRRAFVDFVAASIVQVGPPLGFRDDGFTGRSSTRALSPARLTKSHYSGRSLPDVAADVAADDSEIRRRLSRVAVAEFPEGDAAFTATEPFGFHLMYLTAPGMERPTNASRRWTPDPNALKRPTQAFFLVMGDEPRDDAWQAVAVRQTGGESAFARGRGVRMDRLRAFRVSAATAVEGAPAAYAFVDDLGGAVKCLWIGVANVDEQDKASAFDYGYAVTPTFQSVYPAGGRGSPSVKFVTSKPERRIEEAFLPGDEFEIEVDLSDNVHAGGDDDIPPERRSLEVALVDPGGTAVEPEGVQVRYADAPNHRYRVVLTIPKDASRFGTWTVRFTVRSRLKLGDEDKHLDETFQFELREDRPAVDNVIVRRDGEIVYQAREHMLRPLPPGPARIEIYFDRPMDQAIPAEVLLDERPLDGTWKGATWWEAEIEVPEGRAFEPWKGFRRLSIQATAPNGARIDTDPDRAGEQPDTDHRFFVGTVPPYARQVTMHAGGEVVYQAEWTGWDGIAPPHDTLDVDFYRGGPRKLEVSVEKSLPADVVGYLHVYIDFTQPFETPPTLTVGGKPVELHMEGVGRVWNGKIPLDEIGDASDRRRSVQLEIGGRDRYGMQLDGNPGTVTLIDPRERAKGRWRHYESRRGGRDDGKGGVDLWHELGASPDMSLVIVLDASGSMRDDQKIEKAKQGIHGLLADLPTKVELGLIVFGGCDGIDVHSFTRDVARLREIVDGTSARGATPLAASAVKARELFLTSAHPRSRVWKCRIFSDGEESCKGDETLSIHELERAIAARAAAPRGDEPEEDPEPPPVDCRPATWTLYRVRARDGGLHLDRIYLDKIDYIERQFPNGGCFAKLSITTHNILYGAIRERGSEDPPAVEWRVQGNSTNKAESVGARDGQAAMSRLRRRAEALRAAGKTKLEVYADIDRLVHENAER